MSNYYTILLDQEVLSRQRLQREFKYIGIMAILALSQPIIFRTTDLLFWGNGLIVVMYLISLGWIFTIQKLTGMKRIELNDDHILVKNKQFSSPLSLHLAHIQSIDYARSKLTFNLVTGTPITVKLKYYGIIQDAKKNIREFALKHKISYQEK